jgi:hypothetical protein
MFDQLLSIFGQSKQGQQAYAQLQSQGYTPQQASGILTTAFPAAAQAMQQHLQGGGQGLGLLNITDGHYAQNFLSAAVTGLLRGEGLKGAAIDGLQGVVGGHVAEVIATRCGLPQRVAGVVGAIITPLMIDFLWEKFQAMQGGGAAAGAPGVPGAPGAPSGFGSSFSTFGR